MKRVERLKHDNDYIIQCNIIFETRIKQSSTIYFFSLSDMYQHLNLLFQVVKTKITYTYEYINNERKLKNEKI